MSVIIFLVLRLLPGNALTSSLGVSAGLLSHAQIVALDRYYGIGDPVVQHNSVVACHSHRQPRCLASISYICLLAHRGRLTCDLRVGESGDVSGPPHRSVFGVFGALRPGRVVDLSGQGVSVVGLGIPSFILGTGIVTLLSAVFHYFPSSETFASLTSNPWLNFQQIIFPAFTLSLGIGGAIMRTARASVLEVTGQNYVRTARGKGLSVPQRDLETHLSQCLYPRSYHQSGIQLGNLLGGP